MYKVLRGLGGKGSSCGLATCCNYLKKKTIIIINLRNNNEANSINNEDFKI